MHNFVYLAQRRSQEFSCEPNFGGGGCPGLSPPWLRQCRTLLSPYEGICIRQYLFARPLGTLESLVPLQQCVHARLDVLGGQSTLGREVQLAARRNARIRSVDRNRQTLVITATTVADVTLATQHKAR